MHLQEEERREARRKAQELWAKKREKELKAKLEEEKKRAEQVRLTKLKREKEIEAEKQKQHRYDLYKQKLKEDLRKQIEKEKEALEKQEVEMKYKAELTAQLREEYDINKIVQAPIHAADNNPIPPAPSNFELSTIKTEPFTAKDPANPSEKSVPIKRQMEPVDSNTPPKKRVASAAEFKDLMTPKKSKTNLKNKFCSPKPTSCSKDREDPTFEISNQDYLCSITDVKVEKKKMAHDFLDLKPTKDFTLKLWNGLERSNCLVDQESLEAFGHIESDSFFCIMIQYFPELQSGEDEIHCVDKLRHILARFAAVNCVTFAEVNFLLFFMFCPTPVLISEIVSYINGSKHVYSVCHYLASASWLQQRFHYKWIHLWIHGSKKTFHLHLHTLVYPWFKLLFSDTWILWWIHGSNDCSSALRYLGGSIDATYS